MDPTQVVRGDDGVLRCRECGFAYDLDCATVAGGAGRALDQVCEAVHAAPESLRDRRIAPEMWSINAYTAHLARAAEVILERIRAIAHEDRPFLPYYDEKAHIASYDADHVPVERSLGLLNGTVATFEREVAALPPDAWDRIGRHERAGEVRLSEIAQDMPHELHHHAADIRHITDTLLPPVEPAEPQVAR